MSAGAEDPLSDLPAAELAPMAGALRTLERADFNHRYRDMLRRSRDDLAAEQVRPTLARGVAKRLMVLARAAGDELRQALPPEELAALDDGLAQADALVYDR